MKERPVIFSAASINAIRRGDKTQTRRIISPQPPPGYLFREWVNDTGLSARFENQTEPLGMWTKRCPYGDVGDRLWIREVWGLGCRPDPFDGCVDGIEYKADVVLLEDDREDLPMRRIPTGAEYDRYEGKGWQSSRYMPRWASRLTLEILSVRAERIQSITEEDAKAEGVVPRPYDPEGDCWTDGKYRTAFEFAWNEMHGWDPNAWERNDWVFAIAFKLLET